MSVSGHRILNTPIQVTQEDLDGHRRYAAWKCAVAQAFNRALPCWGWRISVEYACGYGLISRRPRVLVTLPRQASDLIRTIDAGEPGSPLTFEIEEVSWL